MMNQNGDTATTPPVVIRVKRGDDAQRWLFTQPGNLGTAERVASIAAGSLIVYWFGRRLLALMGLIALASFLLYRGVGGYCPITAALNRNRDRTSVASHITDEVSGMPPDSKGSTVERELQRERQRDKIDQRSWESFPASDPPAHG